MKWSWLCLPCVALTLSSCARDASRRDRAVRLLAEHGPELTISALDLSQKPQPVCSTSALGYKGCVQDLPQGRYVTFFIGDLNLVFAPPGSRAGQELNALTSGAHLRCRNDPVPDTFELGKGWYLTDQLRTPGGFQTASLRGRLKNVPTLEKPLQLDLVSQNGNRTELIPVPSGGNFCLDHLFQGNHRIWINYDQPPSGWMPYPKTPLTPEFSILENRMNGPFDFELPSAPLPLETVEVHVRFPDGSPVESAVAKVDYWDQVPTDRNGIARIPVIQRPEHRVSASIVKFRFLFQPVQWESEEVVTANRRSTVTLVEPPH